MEKYDPQVAARVWQRVKGEPPQEHDEAQLQAMIQQEQHAAAVYLQLSRRFPGKDAAALHRLAADAQSHSACLRGIYSLVTGQSAASQTVSVPQEPLEAALRRCYGRAMHTLTQYEHWSSHREYGPVFSRLAQQEQEHCRILLELLGKQHRK